ncbi:hypothetical protein [Actinomadura madurae]|uniref:hypothetical protein n=1 Tax=Actinomadura madurae TaxID=1993 RepID=UPI0020D2449F|nr:hypothetical protein [Actinomadura madurae]MCP9967752.1 hypothetical protein [Actinomadura madurae]MCP9980200.1 hypothetical protein [Actinomadura madurae]MCQ0008275.1 hypothetical protein [Actinomadura madurae]MCQ0016413.1 hypothetical protein [Actinomadura madurae]
MFQAPSGRSLAASGLRESVASTLEATGQVDGVVGVGDPLEEGEVSADGRTAVAEVQFEAKLEGEAANKTLLAVKDAGGEARAAGLACAARRRGIRRQASACVWGRRPIGVIVLDSPSRHVVGDITLARVRDRRGFDLIKTFPAQNPRVIWCGGDRSVASRPAWRG